MIRLFGVVHGGYTTDILLQKRVIELEPTAGLESKLRQLPKNSRIGIGNLSQKDWKEVKAYLEKQCSANHLYVSYSSSNKYWNKIAQICNSSGHEVVWLEDKEDWFRYILAKMEIEKLKRKYDELCYKEEESDKEYHEKIITLNEELHKAEIFAHKIHLMDRDKTLLKNIVLKKCDVAIAGIGHTDAWILEQARIKKEYGIEFGQYSTDVIAEPYDFTLKFIENAVPDPNIAYEFTGLRRSINLQEQGKFSDENPDWVGIWDVYEPSKSYFELFIERKRKEHVTGRIEDVLGTAQFKGIFTPRFVRFVKSYIISTRNAIKSDIVYETKDAGYDREMHQGVFRCDAPASPGSTGRFYMEKPNKNSPLQMSLSWYDLKQDDDVGQKKFF